MSLCSEVCLAHAQQNTQHARHGSLMAQSGLNESALLFQQVFCIALSITLYLFGKICFTLHRTVCFTQQFAVKLHVKFFMSYLCCN